MDSLGPWPLSELTPLVERAAAVRKPIVFMGSGSEVLRNPASKRIISHTIAPRVSFWTVRSNADRARLVEYGVSPDVIGVAADLAWGLDAVSPAYGRKSLEALGVASDEKLIAVNVSCEEFILRERPNFLEIIASALDAVAARKDGRVVFLSNEIRETADADYVTSHALRSLMRRQDKVSIMPNIYRTPQEMMSIIACCGVAITTRYHFSLFSAIQGVPFIGIERSSKVADLASDLSWPHSVSLGALDADRLIEMLEEVEINSQALIQHLSSSVAVLRERSRRNDAALVSLDEVLRGDRQPSRSLRSADA